MKESTPMKMTTKSKTSLTIPTPTHGLRLVKWDLYLPIYLKRTLYPSRIEKLYSSLNHEIRPYRLNHQLWIGKFGIICHRTPKRMIKTSDASYIISQRQLDLLTIRYVW